MDIRRNEFLERKYWEGSSTLEEEQEIRHAVAENASGLSAEIKALFSISEAKSEVELSDDFDAAFWEKTAEAENKSVVWNVSLFMKYAAAGIILFGLTMALWNLLLNNGPMEPAPAIEISQVDTYTDPQVAFEETKRALTFAAAKLNKGKEPITEIKRFYDARVSISGMDNTPAAKDSIN